jgi:hypothetical protein
MSDQTMHARTPPRGGSMPAGLEEPPRVHPPNLPPQPEIPQTYDPRVSVQLERAARDRAAGKPGSAAREDLERAVEDPQGRAGPRRARTGEEGTAPAEFERETVVTFTTQFASYFPGESAAFTEDEAARLGDLGVTEGGSGGPPAAPPVNVDVPHVSQAGTVLTCTMGIWDNEPTSYAYQWQIAGTDVGTDSASYDRAAGDVGQTATCVVTATNALGSTAAPPSNAVVVT